ncbi:MAG TPA: cytochrome c peroxidase [Nannocystaceae bacterium]|nr:cytochrome c peroxidase [Nannocystaceae bacterium]
MSPPAMVPPFAFASLRSRGIRRMSLGVVAAGCVLACEPAQLPVHKGAPRAERAKSASRFEAAGGATAKPISPAAMKDRARTVMAALPSAAESPSNPLTDEKVELGRMLFHDQRLSKNQDISCATCHDLAAYGIDVRERDGKRVATSPGHRDQLGERNSPTVYNAGLAFVQFWDGRAADLEAQVMKPLTNPVEMAMPDEAAVVRVVASIPGYVDAFAQAFPDERDPVSAKTIALAIGAFERKLVTPGRFDAFMKGDLAALEQQELRGLQLFFDAGCTQCHTGAGIGGTQFQKLGSVKAWPGLKDEGRFRETEDPKDRFVFKVPTLRNVTRTGPYLHDGSIESLEEMVELMAEHQSTRGRLKPAEAAAIVAFLGTLEGELPTALIAAPTLPPSGPDTPTPDAS